LDSARREDVLSHIARIAQSEQIPIVYVTHSLDEVLRLADRLVIIEDGKVSADGSVGSVLNSRAKSGHLPPDERATVVEGLIEAAGGKGGLSIVDTPIGLVQIAGLSAPPRARVRLRLRAADISLALREPQDVSINNILPGHVVEISQDGPAAALVMLDCGAPLMARVTQNSVQRLGLAPGVRLYAMIKAVAVERVSIGGLLDSRPLGWPGD
ncbi:MAG: TOBE domain-containing protein, partial [Pseudomonadota bacterium]